MRVDSNSNSDDRCQRQKQGGAVGAAASRMRVPPKARSSRWEPRPGFLFCAARAIHPRPPRTPVSDGYRSFCFISLERGDTRVDSNSSGADRRLRRKQGGAATRAPYTARLAQSTRAHQKASTYTSTRYPCSPCFRFSVCIRNFNCWTFFLHFDMLFLLYPFHFCTVNVKAKDQSCKAFWLNNSGLFCWSLCNSPFCLSIILQRCTLSHGGGC